MNTPIAHRLHHTATHWYDPSRLSGIMLVRVFLDNEIFLTKEVVLMEENTTGYMVVDNILKEWKCQDQILNTELKYRKTIISSCGQLTVTESPA